MHIRNGHIQMTKPPHTTVQLRGKESMGLHNDPFFKIDTTNN
jgi:hypothetical protein